MKNYMIAIAAAAATLATPAFAGDFSGPRLEVTAGVDDVTKPGTDATPVTYGAGLGYDLQFGKVVLGVEATADNVFDRRDLSGAARLGYVINENILAYGKVGYANFKPNTRLELDGLRVGGGIEANLVGPVYGKVEYRYTDFKGPVGKHGGLVGVGLRF